MKKYVLELEDEGIDFDLVGICSSLSDYRMAWEINQKLNIHLKKAIAPYINKIKNKPDSSHGVYHFEDDNYRMHYFLIKNKSINQYLIPELSQIDYLLFLKNNSKNELEQWVAKIKQCDFVQTAIQLAPEEYKSCKNITFDEYEKN